MVWPPDFKSGAQGLTLKGLTTLDIEPMAMLIMHSLNHTVVTVCVKYSIVQHSHKWHFTEV